MSETKVCRLQRQQDAIQKQSEVFRKVSTVLVVAGGLVAYALLVRLGTALRLEIFAFLVPLPLAFLLAKWSRRLRRRISQLADRKRLATVAADPLSASEKAFLELYEPVRRAAHDVLAGDPYIRHLHHRIRRKRSHNPACDLSEEEEVLADMMASRERRRQEINDRLRALRAQAERFDLERLQWGYARRNEAARSNLREADRAELKYDPLLEEAGGALQRSFLLSLADLDSGFTDDDQHDSNPPCPARKDGARGH